MRAFQQSAVKPTAHAERIETLDILRGLALFGMILVHFHSHSLELGGVNDLVRTAIWRLVETKSHGLFALLFGAGFALQLRRADEKGAPFFSIYLRRLAVLALFGFAAHALFGFNVLLSYAVWGVPLLLIRRRPTWFLLVLAVLSSISLALYSLIETFVVLGPEAAEAAFAAEQENGERVKASLHAAVAQADYAQLLAARLRHMAWFYTQPYFLTPGATVALFIMGLLAVRHHIFEQPLAHKRVIVAMMVFGAMGWVVANWLPPGWMMLGLLRDQWLVFTYVGGLLLLLAWFPPWVGHLRLIGRAGSMALTNYLLQIAVLDVLFSGYGLHMPEIMPIVVPLATCLLFGVEVVMSAAWMARFRFGPAEWAWRSLTYGQAQPLRR